MTAPQLRFYVAPRAGHQAVVNRDTGEVAAWIVRDGDQLRARRGGWVSEAAQTVAEVIGMVAARVDRRGDTGDR